MRHESGQCERKRQEETAEYSYSRPDLTVFSHWRTCIGRSKRSSLLLGCLSISVTATSETTCLPKPHGFFYNTTGLRSFLPRRISSLVVLIKSKQWSYNITLTLNTLTWCIVATFDEFNRWPLLIYFCTTYLLQARKLPSEVINKFDG